MLNELYQDIIVDHTRAPRNFGTLEHPTHQAEGNNPLCGDQLHLFLTVDDKQIIRAIKFQGSGCSIATASASLMTESLLGKTLTEAKHLFNEFHAMLTHEQFDCPEKLDKLAVFSGVKNYPARVKCATLAWHTFNAALQHQSTPVSTESK